MTVQRLIQSIDLVIIILINYFMHLNCNDDYSNNYTDIFVYAHIYMYS